MDTTNSSRSSGKIWYHGGKWEDSDTENICEKLLLPQRFERAFKNESNKIKDY